MFIAAVNPVTKQLALPQYGLLGFDLENCDNEGSSNPEPNLLDTNSRSPVLLCDSQGSGKSSTLSCILENHLLKDSSVGVQRQKFLVLSLTGTRTLLDHLQKQQACVHRVSMSVSLCLGATINR
jgi:hypothetical protein